MAKRSPGGTPATVALTRAGIDFTLHPYEHHDDATGFGDEAAEALGVPKRGSSRPWSPMSAANSSSRSCR